MIMDNQQEIFPLVDEDGKVIGSATRGECHSGSKFELDGGRFWTMQEIQEAIGQNILTPNFESEFTRCFLNSKFD